MMSLLLLVHLYADDTILYTSGPSLDTVLTNLQTSYNDGLCGKRARPSCMGWGLLDSGGREKGVEYLQAMGDSIGLRSTSRLQMDMYIRMYWFRSVKSPLQSSSVCDSRFKTAPVDCKERWFTPSTAGSHGAEFKGILSGGATSLLQLT